MELIAGAILYSVIIITLGALTAYCLKIDWPLLAVIFAISLITVSCNIKITSGPETTIETVK